MRSTPWATLGVVLALTAACAGEVPAAGSPAPPAPPSGSDAGRVVDAERIAASGARTAWEALRLLGTLRLDTDAQGMPIRIASRGRSSVMMDAPPKVILNGLEVESLFLLEQIPADAIAEIRFYSGPEATTRFGMNSGHGAVVITMKGR